MRLIIFLLFAGWRWLRAGCRNTLQMCLGHVPPTAPHSHQPQSAASDQRSGLFEMHKECDARCSRDSGRDGSYTEPPAA